MTSLIEELLYYSRINSNRIQYHFDKISIRAYFDDCADELGDDLDGRRAELHYESDVSSSVLGIADTEQLKKVIGNLVSNSMKYMSEKPLEITIRLMDQGDFVECTVSDNGIGVEKKDLERLFERFYRTDASRNSSQGGSGIGLSIVKKIIEDHGGQIWASCEKGEGLAVHFILRKYVEVELNA